MDGLTEGRIVHYVMPDGKHRPAIIVQVWQQADMSTGYANLVVFVDGANDLHYPSTPDKPDQVTLWKTSIYYSDEKKVNTWHWIEKA